MTDDPAAFPVVREAVASFADRRHFHAAVSKLLAAGFAPSDLSVLASHDPLATAREPNGSPEGWLPAALSGEISYLEPLTGAGIILLSGGPIAVALAALVAAGLGTAAVKQLFDDYTAPPHRDDFHAALKTGNVLLWVRCEDPERELTATRILDEAGGRHVHIHGRRASAGESGG
jgi:hypothetical protein